MRKTNLTKILLGGVALAGMALAAPAATAAEPGYTFALITHAQPGDTFWDIIRKGAEAAAKKDHVKLLYEANPNAAGETQLVNTMVQQHVDGIALTLAFPDAEIPAVKQAEAAKIPVVGLNAGTDQWKQAGLMMYVGQDETVAGQAVGNKLNDEGVKSAICVDQQQGAVQLQARCDGIKDTFKGQLQVLYVNGYDMASAQARMVAALQQNPNVGYIVTLGAPFAPTAVQAVQLANSIAKVGTFDMNPQAVGLIEKGKVQWAVDQQPFVQGYEAIDLLWLYKTNGDIVGGGGPVLTGPTFVTTQNVAEIAKFVKEGTR
ncbi:substrate-binding domain-containing protein [Acidocella facilis]|uniref:substrate-binding domain-containing protein n=1 Tax=Acidocella facilis TaxID=525 RepID=UPI001F272BE4|nr:substrate-binding domain-containing protein [Acidocella facilis]